MSGNLQPVAITGDELAQIIGDIGQHILDRDSFSGTLQYSALDGPLCPQCNGMAVFPTVDETCDLCDGYGTEPLPPGKHFWVTAIYRIGNSQGQGGVRMVGEVPS